MGTFEVSVKTSEQGLTGIGPVARIVYSTGAPPCDAARYARSGRLIY